MIHDYVAERELLPEYPSTPHLPFQPNTSRGDSVASALAAEIIFTARSVTVEEKIDGASVGITLGADSVPIIRNRNHILRKGYTARTEAKRQFAPLWNYAYEIAGQVQRLRQAAGALVAVYGEWLVMTHGTQYLACYKKEQPFIAYDLYDPDLRAFLDPVKARSLLLSSGFTVPDLLVERVESYEQLAVLARAPSRLSTTDPREGVYIKVGDGERLTHRFKMVRLGFVPGLYFEKRT